MAFDPSTARVDELDPAPTVRRPRQSEVAPAASAPGDTGVKRFDPSTARPDPGPSNVVALTRPRPGGDTPTSSPVIRKPFDPSTAMPSPLPLSVRRPVVPPKDTGRSMGEVASDTALGVVQGGLNLGGGAGADTYGTKEEAQAAFTLEGPVVAVVGGAIASEKTYQNPTLDPSSPAPIHVLELCAGVKLDDEPAGSMDAIRIAENATIPNIEAKNPKPWRASRLRVEMFVQQYLLDLNGTQAAIRAGYSRRSARFIASELLAKPEIQIKIRAAMDARAEKTGITKERFLQFLWDVATADPRELVSLHRTCCRYCWGEGHRHQWTPSEIGDAEHEHQVAVAQALHEGRRAPLAPDLTGGLGWNAANDPHPDCPECWGSGVVRIVVCDTRDLSPAGAALFAGLRVTAHGIEVKLRDQDAALVLLAKCLGLF